MKIQTYNDDLVFSQAYLGSKLTAERENCFSVVVSFGTLRGDPDALELMVAIVF